MPLVEHKLRLVDLFMAEARSRDTPLPGELEECFMFGDLEWSPNRAPGEKADAVLARTKSDPAFTIEGRSRWVAFARVVGEIRYYAAPIPTGLPWYWTGEDPARVAALHAEENVSELGVVASVAGAVTLTLEYLSGSSLTDIDVPRENLKRAT